MIVSYLWNIDLAEAILPSLHAFEVALRNAVARAAADITGNPRWFLDPQFLKRAQFEDAQRAFNKVSRKSPPLEGRVIAQLMLGFWTAMLSSPYEQTLWRPNNFAALYAVFPGAQNANPSGNNFSLKTIYETVKLINVFRNRVFHYEKIYAWHYTGDNPAVRIPRTAADDHRLIHDTLLWMNPAVHQIIQAVDDFPRAWHGRADLAANLTAQLCLRQGQQTYR